MRTQKKNQKNAKTQFPKSFFNSKTLILTQNGNSRRAIKHGGGTGPNRDSGAG